ncbi:unnamed protein product [Gongylonema pulchrum]|uniref:RNA polymerase II-associated factor 1 homolog n=1 Tax=Gongylonema pulchrum TaxID=637853 RepID=A0A183E737_9BILA|nr:unnamed protein product [Gongylonema pulchrum]
MMDEEGEQFVTYFLPSSETLEKRIRDTEEGLEYDPTYEYEYNSVRDYNWLVRNKSTKGYEQDIFLFSFRDGAVYYNELETRVSLNRRKTKRARKLIVIIHSLCKAVMFVFQQETKLMVRNRAYDDSELFSQQERLNNLLHPYDEKDEGGKFLYLLASVVMYYCRNSDIWAAFEDLMLE